MTTLDERTRLDTEPLFDIDASPDHDAPRDDREDTSWSSGSRLFPIGFGLGALAALALFFGYRAVVPGAGGDARSVAAPTEPPALASAPDATSSGDPSAITASAGSTSANPTPPSADADDRRAATAKAPAATEAYAAADADVAAATPASPPLAGFEALASLDATAGVSDLAGDGPTGSSEASGGAGLPSIEDPATSDLFGGPVMMISSAVPRVIVLADGTNLVPGETLPGGHRIVDIRRERILLERDGVEWRVRVP